jgi:hypothetical protein
MPSVANMSIMLSAILLCVVMLSVVMMNVVMPNVVTLSVLAPFPNALAYCGCSIGKKFYRIRHNRESKLIVFAFLGKRQFGVRSYKTFFFVTCQIS